MSKYIYFFSGATKKADPSARLRTGLGGKGENLARLKRAGFPVPRGFCVKANAYLRFIKDNGLDRSIESILGEPGDLFFEEKGTKIQEAIRSSPFPPSVFREITEAYRLLCDKLEGKAPSHFLGEGRVRVHKLEEAEKGVAVRSSAEWEDTPEASFAGQYESYLNVMGAKAVEEGVKDCWASLWTPRAMAYRANRGLKQRGGAMAVVVQEMVPAAASGVLFTANPITGNRDEIVINSAFGLGEGIAMGLVEPDIFTLDKGSLAVKETALGEKESMTVPLPQGGTGRVELPPERRKAPSLTEAQLRTLAEMAVAVEKHLGAPQDMEWAFGGEKLYILQSRPITALPSAIGGVGTGSQEPFPVLWEKEEDRRYLWTLSNEGGTPSEPMAPMDAFLQSLWFRGRYNAATLMGDAVGTEFRAFNGYPYIRDAPTGLTEGEQRERKRAYERMVMESLEEEKTLWEAQLLPEIAANLEHLKAFSRAEASLRNLVDHIMDALWVYERHWTLHWLMASELSRRRWPAVFAELTGNPDRRAAQRLLTAYPNKTTELISRLRALAKKVKGSPGLARAFALQESQSFEGMTKEMGDTAEGRAFLRELEDFMEAYGYRSGGGFGSHSSIFYPTWKDNPSLVLALISRYVEQDLEELDRREQAILAERDRAAAEALERVAPENRERFLKEWDLGQRVAAFMEDHNFYIEQATTSLVRLALLELGTRLAKDGALQERDDVFYLAPEDIAGAVSGAMGNTLSQIIKLQKAQLAQWAKLTPPQTLGNVDAQGDTASPPGPPSQREADEPGVLRGRGVSPGRATGRARVVPPGELVPNLKPGDILVSQNAGPLWTPLFPILSGLVLDEGAGMQHAAIIAREYRIPAVLQTKVATEVIQDGQTITADGTSGIVYFGPNHLL